MSTSLSPFERYNAATKYPDSQFRISDRISSATWFMGNNYKVKSGYYGAYPYGYLDRMHQMFPDVHSVLHVFSGKVAKGLWPLEHTVDVNPELNPTYCLSAETMCEFHPFGGVHTDVWDVVFADPPYSPADAEKYGTKMPNRRLVLKQCIRAVKPGGYVVWLDTVWPMFSKKEMAMVGTVSMWRCTNHRIRGVSFFRRPEKEGT